jgi:multidrug transporter EmrE-like cation transporter
MLVDVAGSIAALTVSILCTAMGNLFYKYYFKVPRVGFVIAAIFFFVVSPLTTSIALKNLSIDIVYMTASCSIVLVLLGARFVFEERINNTQRIGVVLLLLGVFVYNI